jgi:ribosomal protein L18
VPVCRSSAPTCTSTPASSPTTARRCWPGVHRRKGSARATGQGKGGNVAAAALIGKRIAEKAKAAGVEKVAFDRSGFAYHGRVKALAEAAREAGLQF